MYGFFCAIAKEVVLQGMWDVMGSFVLSLASPPFTAVASDSDAIPPMP